MKRSKLMLILTILTALAASMTLTRCGSGIGSTMSANANGMKS